MDLCLVFLFFFYYEGEDLEAALRIAGLVRLDSIAAVDCLRWVLPEALLLSTSLSLYIVCIRPRKTDPEECHVDVTRTDSNTESQDPAIKSKFNFLTAIGMFVPQFCAWIVQPTLCILFFYNSQYFVFRKICCSLCSLCYWRCVPIRPQHGVLLVLPCCHYILVMLPSTGK